MQDRGHAAAAADLRLPLGGDGWVRRQGHIPGRELDRKSSGAKLTRDESADDFADAPLGDPHERRALAGPARRAGDEAPAALGEHRAEGRPTDTPTQRSI